MKPPIESGAIFTKARFSGLQENHQWGRTLPKALHENRRRCYAILCRGTSISTSETEQPCACWDRLTIEVKKWKGQWRCNAEADHVADGNVLAARFLNFTLLTYIQSLVVIFPTNAERGQTLQLFGVCISTVDCKERHGRWVDETDQVTEIGWQKCRPSLEDRICMAFEIWSVACGDRKTFEDYFLRRNWCWCAQRESDQTMCGFDEVPHIAGYLKAALTPRSTYTIML